MSILRIRDVVSRKIFIHLPMVILTRKTIQKLCIKFFPEGTHPHPRIEIQFFFFFYIFFFRMGLIKNVVLLITQSDAPNTIRTITAIK